MAQRKVEILARGRVVRFEASDVIAAIELHRLTQISFWDALIVHAARSAGVAVLYTEDLHAGVVLGGVRVVNPFVKEHSMTNRR
jgi:predicted nucleic acid-binding protein